MNALEEVSGKTRRHQWNKGPLLKEVTASWKQEDIQQIGLEIRSE
jgi:hypothetical protein